MRRTGNVLTIICLALIASACAREVPGISTGAGVIVDRDVPIAMRDQVVLRADVYRPESLQTGPVLVYRTPYGKHNAARDYQTHLRAVERGYVVVLQDVRGRYASDGLFNPYINEGQDGFDTIAWAAAQSWSNGDVGTYGLSYPGAVQWLAAIESPPRLKAMAPAMTFSTPRNFFYMNGVFDLSWLPWVYNNIAPDARVRLGVDGAISQDEVAARWQTEGADIQSFLPLAELPQLREEAAFYFEWLQHPPADSWWDWAEIRGRHDRTDAAVLNLSGWYDEAYGPEGAITNFSGVVASREKDAADAHLLIGPWQHGVGALTKQALGVMDFGPRSLIDYDEELLRFFDHYLKRPRGAPEYQPAVRFFVMGANEWRTSKSWPPPGIDAERLCLTGRDGAGSLGTCDALGGTPATSFHADPQDPVVDPFGTFEPHDFQQLAARSDVLVFDSPPLMEALTIAGNSVARMFVSCNCADFDLWVRLLDVHPDGRAINLMSPGADVQRMSVRGNREDGQLLTPGEIYEVEIGGLLTANRFAAGHRIRIQISASFAPHLSRNLQTGISETVSADSMPATITIHHSHHHPSSLTLPVLD